MRNGINKQSPSGAFAPDGDSLFGLRRFSAAGHDKISVPADSPPYYVTRAFAFAKTAANALGVINGSSRAVNGNGSGGAVLFADAAGNTADVAELAHLRSLQLRHAPDPVGTVVRNEPD